MGIVLPARPDELDDVTEAALAHPAVSLYAALKNAPKPMEWRRRGPIQVD
jgi:hypothetical protein